MKATSSPDDIVNAAFIKQHIQAFAPFYCDIINCSFDTGIVPKTLKQVVVTPLLKKNSLNQLDVTNYRPISGLLFLAKIMERKATHQFQNHLEQEGLLDSRQSGFRPGRSTETSLLDITDRMLRERDQGHSIALALLDLSAAFDTVDHDILSHRRKSVAHTGDLANKWITSFLKSRSQKNRLGKLFSPAYKLSCGVPQGSAL